MEVKVNGTSASPSAARSAHCAVRGFAVKYRGNVGEERLVITAAHCLEHAFRADGVKGLPPCHPGRYLQEETYKNLLGPLRGKSTVWAACRYVDPIADIAVLGGPDEQDLSAESDAYDRQLESLETLPIADAPTQGRERIRLRAFASGYPDQWIEQKTPGKGSARVLSLKGRWLRGRVERRGNRLSFTPGRFFVGGMSGSPIIDATGAAIGVCSTEMLNPVIVDTLSAAMLKCMMFGKRVARGRPTGRVAR